MYSKKRRSSSGLIGKRVGAMVFIIFLVVMTTHQVSQSKQEHLFYHCYAIFYCLELDVPKVELLSFYCAGSDLFSYLENMSNTSWLESVSYHNTQMRRCELSLAVPLKLSLGKNKIWDKTNMTNYIARCL